MSPKVVLSGYYGKGNLGDEVLLHTIVEDVKSHFPQAEFTIFCSDPQPVINTHYLPAFSRRPFDNFFAKMLVLREADIFINGGGTHLEDHHNWFADIKAAAAYLFWPLLAKMLQVPIVSYGQGIGQVNHKITYWIIRYIYSRFDGITLRDSRSLKIFENIMGCKTNAITTCDPAISSPFCMPENITQIMSDKIRSWIAESQPYTIVALRRQPKEIDINLYGDFYQKIAFAVANFQRQTNSKIAILEIANSNDYHDRDANKYFKDYLMKQDINHSLILDINWSNFTDGIALLQNADLVISSRLHALMLAACAGVAVVGLTHKNSDKVRSCLEMIGLNPACTYIDDYESGDNFLRVILSAWTTRINARELITKSVRKWAVGRRANIDMVSCCLNKKI